jgi:two-component system, NtrC family, sensor kinase
MRRRSSTVRPTDCRRKNAPVGHIVPLTTELDRNTDRSHSRWVGDSPPIDDEQRERAELYFVNRLVTVGELAASMAHELGTPLAVVQARAQMIAAGEVDPSELRKEAEVIVEQTRRMTQMVRDVLELAQPKPPVQIAVDLGALARKTVTLLEPLGRKRNAKIVVVGEATKLEVLGDPSKLLQILTNLAMNGIQSMPRGGMVRLAVATRRARQGATSDAVEYACVDVRDEGEGIAESVRPHVFETFFTTKRAGEGTGLGLSVSHRLAREHGGWIAVESEPGEGSCFTLYLPPLGSQ